MFEGLFRPMPLLVILFIVPIIFGPGKLPALGEGLGKSIPSFKEVLPIRKMDLRRHCSKAPHAPGTRRYIRSRLRSRLQQKAPNISGPFAVSGSICLKMKRNAALKRNIAVRDQVEAGVSHKAQLWGDSDIDAYATDEAEIYVAC